MYCLEYTTLTQQPNPARSAPVESTASRSDAGVGEDYRQIIAELEKHRELLRREMGLEEGQGVLSAHTCFFSLLSSFSLSCLVRKT